MRHVGRVVGAADGRLVLGDGAQLNAATVAWCTASLPRFGWVDIPAAFDADGWPVHVRGVVTSVPGLAFM